MSGKSKAGKKAHAARPKAKSAARTAETPKRLVPKPEVLRELYMLSGNNCAMPDCDGLIIDSKGVVVGHVCHIEAAKPDGARFNSSMTNEQRREGSNLVLMCSGHHTQIDSKAYEKEYDLERVRKIKRNHEAQFKGVGSSLRQSFRSAYADTTDKLNPTGAGSCRRLEAVLPECIVDEEDAAKRESQIAGYVERMSKVPERERDFMLAVIRRAAKLGVLDSVLVHVDDVRHALGVREKPLKNLGDALERYGVGDIDLVSTKLGEEYHVFIRDPSEFVAWFDIVHFCEKTGLDLDEFVIRLKFGLLD